MTTTDSWLPLAEYSIKHQISISTLRRRIKSDELNYRLDDGKYFILDDSPQRHGRLEDIRPSLKSESFKQAGPEKTTLTPASVEAGESVITAANRLLADLKKAYSQILQEKEEQILHLREEVVDLKTLVKILETENARLHERS
jgi:hypothetical protein